VLRADHLCADAGDPPQTGFGADTVDIEEPELNESAQRSATVTPIRPDLEGREGSPERIAFELAQYIRYWDTAEKAKRSRKDILSLYAECLQVARMGRYIAR
jgi:hypothetical protein